MPKYSIIVPVYNRPEEVEELLESLAHQTDQDFEVIIVEDGSSRSSAAVIELYSQKLDLSYYAKENSGPGLSRNYGAERTSGEWLIFLDSDCFVPADYIASISKFLTENEIELFGGPDRDHPTFTNLQRGINYSMTSILTTGGIRGGKKSLEKFKPRSFNMGVRTEVFQELGGFSNLRFGEDIDFSLRVQATKLKSALIPDAFTYHKRRSTFWQFYKQIFNSGVARIVLSKLHKGSLRLIHTLPTLFLIGHITILVLAFLRWEFIILFLPIPLIVLFHSLLITRKFGVAIMAVLASYIQFFAYGMGFLKGFFTNLFKKRVKHSFVEKFYDP